MRVLSINQYSNNVKCFYISSYLQTSLQIDLNTAQNYANKGSKHTTQNGRYMIKGKLVMNKKVKDKIKDKMFSSPCCVRDDLHGSARKD